MLNISLNSSFDEAPFISENKTFLLLTTILWVLISFIGVLANICVISVASCSSGKKSATHYFITNLAVSDILFLLISPTLALFNLHRLIKLNSLPELLGKLVCKTDFYLSHLTVFITCLTLMSMTFDRYMAIMYPLKSLSFRSTNKAIFINLTIWIVSIILCIPHGYFRVMIQDELNSSYCSDAQSLFELAINLRIFQLNYSQLNFLYTITIAYLIPLIVIVVCFLIMMKRLTKEKPMFTQSSRKSIVSESNKKRRVLLMIAVVTILFGLCWLPIHGFHFALRFFRENFPYESSTLFIFKIVAHTLIYLNSMLNPFFYTIMGNNFRKQVLAKRVQYSTRIKACKSRNNVINSNPAIRPFIKNKNNFTQFTIE